MLRTAYYNQQKPQLGMYLESHDEDAESVQHGEADLRGNVSFQDRLVHHVSIRVAIGCRGHTPHCWSSLTSALQYTPVLLWLHLKWHHHLCLVHYFFTRAHRALVKGSAQYREEGSMWDTDLPDTVEFLDRTVPRA